MASDHRLHPVWDAAARRGLRSAGLDPDWIRQIASGEQPCSLPMAELLLRVFGVEFDAWAVLERDVGSITRAPELPAQPLRRRGRMSTSADTHPVTHPKRIGAIIDAAHRGKKHPFLVWLGSHSVGQWASQNGYKRVTVQSYMSTGKGHRNPPRAFVELVARQSNGEVPVSAWGRIRDT